jgi:hypothetical protein
MPTIHDQKPDSIIREIRCLKEDNAAEYGFDIRLIGAAVQMQQRQHPERMVTRILTDAEKADGKQPLTRPVTESELY